MSTITAGQENSHPIEIYYENYGVGSPVVLLAAYPLSSASWEKQVPALLAAGHRVIAYDRRGFGRSSRPSQGYDFDTLASDLNILLTTLNLTDVSLVGDSMGAGEVIRYFGKYGSKRVRKAVFISTMGPFWLKAEDNLEGWDKSVFDGLKASMQQDRPATLRGILNNAHNFDVLGGKLVSEQAIENFWNVAVDASPIAAVKCFDAWIEDLRQDIPHIDVPTLILHADESDRVLPPAVSSHRMIKLIKDCKFVEFKDAPHNIQWTHADRVNEELVSFLQ
jgi:pimeloyl-ACP methyl ester carboxylesterase